MVTREEGYGCCGCCAIWAATSRLSGRAGKTHEESVNILMFAERLEAGSGNVRKGSLYMKCYPVFLKMRKWKQSAETRWEEAESGANAGDSWNWNNLPFFLWALLKATAIICVVIGMLANTNSNSKPECWLERYFMLLSEHFMEGFECQLNTLSFHIPPLHYLHSAIDEICSWQLVVK